MSLLVARPIAATVGLLPLNVEQCRALRQIYHGWKAGWMGGSDPSASDKLLEGWELLPMLLG